MRRILPLVLLLSPVLILGCGDDDNVTNPAGNADAASIRIMLTDAPSDYIESAEVVISRVYLVAAPDTLEDSTAVPAAAVDLLPEADAPLVFDLMLLRDGIEAFLGEVDVDEGAYHQLRLVVDSATVTLAEGYVFPDSTDTADLKTPSGHRSGIKVQLADPIPADEGKVTIVTVDFDVDDNFVIQGNPETPAGIKGVLFKPVLKEKHRTQEDDTDEGNGT